MKKLVLMAAAIVAVSFDSIRIADSIAAVEAAAAQAADTVVADSAVVAE